MPSSNQDSTRRRGRPGVSVEQRDEMRAKIAHAAKHLFRTEGYGQISMRRIASEIGCSPMTLYKYYDAKIDILRTLWGDVLNDVFDRIDQIDHGQSSPEQRLKLIASTYVNYWLENTDYYRLVFMADGVTQPEVSLFLDDSGIFARYASFSSAIANAHPKSIAPELLHRKVEALICFLNGIAHNMITISGYKWASADTLIETVIGSFVGTYP